MGHHGMFLSKLSNCAATFAVCFRWLMDNCGTAHLSTSAVLFMATVLGDFFLSGHQLERTTNFAARVRTLMMTLAFKKVKKF